MNGIRFIIVRVLGALSGFISLFFVFYTVRLMWITRGLTSIRTGGRGAYVGAVAFPLLAGLFAFGARRLLKMVRGSNQPETMNQQPGSFP